MKEILKQIDALIEASGYCIVKNDLDLDTLKNVKNRLEHIRSELKLLSIAIVSKSVAKQYSEFCVRCDREGLPLLELDDWIKQYCC